MHSQKLRGKSVVVFGGSSGIGFSVAQLALQSGADVSIVGRSTQKLEAAKSNLDESVQAVSVNMTDDAAVVNFLKSFGAHSIDHLVITASTSVQGAFADLSIDAAQSMFLSKFWGPYRVLKAALPYFAEGASATLFSGVLSRRPSPGVSALAAVNAAVEGLTRGLALELGGQLRINAVSPGLTRTGAYSEMPEEARQAMFESAAAALPARKVGSPEEVAAAVLFLMTNEFMTGHVLDIDGGALLV